MSTGLVPQSGETFVQSSSYQPKVDFPGLDPNCSENPSISFVHESQVISGVCVCVCHSNIVFMYSIYTEYADFIICNNFILL